VQLIAFSGDSEISQFRQCPVAVASSLLSRHQCSRGVRPLLRGTAVPELHYGGDLPTGCIRGRPFNRLGRRPENWSFEDQTTWASVPLQDACDGSETAALLPVVRVVAD
jgi:hypothetical protein